MGKERVLASCGHEFVAEVNGDEEEERRRLSFLSERGLCPACYREERDRVREEEAEILESALGGLPVLLGTERQVKWARAIRGELVSRFLGEFRGEMDTGALGEAIGRRAPGTEVFLERRASYWIDNRKKTLNTLIKSSKRESATREKIALG